MTLSLSLTGSGQAAYGISQNDYTGIIGLGLSVGLGYALAIADGKSEVPEGAWQSPAEPCLCTPSSPRTLVMLDYYAVADAPLGATHADVTVVNPDPAAASYRVSAGPAPENRNAGNLGVGSGALLATSGGSPFGTIRVTGQFEHIAASGVPFASTVVEVPLPYDQVVSSAREFVRLGNAASARYSPLFMNSNSVAHSLPSFLGVPRPSPPIFAPGSGWSFP